jgi:hypothetical protein
MKRTTAVLAFFVAAVLAGVFVNSTLLSASPVVKEKFMQKERGMPTETGPVEGYSGGSPLLGTQPLPTPERPYDQVDDQKLFAFADNRQGPECKGSPFSGDLGYVCLTDSQRAEFATRAGNRSS